MSDTGTAAAATPAADWTWKGYSQYEAVVDGGRLHVYAVAAGLFQGWYHCRTNPSHSRSSSTNHRTVAAAQVDAERCYAAAPTRQNGI